MSAADKNNTTTTPLPAVSLSLSFQGKTIALEDGVVTTETTGKQLHQLIQQTLQQEKLLWLIPDDADDGDEMAASSITTLSSLSALKILCKGKRIEPNDDHISSAFFSSSSSASSTTKKPIKLLVMATNPEILADLASKRSDPTIRGFDQEKKTTAGVVVPFQPWGPTFAQQDKNYKFCRFEACTWQSFGHRPTDGTTPHAFRAMQLLEQLAFDPGVVAVLQERELVVGTLGEMDPIDDRVMQQKQQEQQGSCLLGYNTNGGMRIDLKLRTDDLKGFRPYPQLVTTLLHELSHNWVGEHNALFWTNFAQMRAEYLTRHKALQSTIIEGQTTAERAGLNRTILHDIPQTIWNELIPEMAQHGLHPRMIEAPIRQRCQELEQEFLQGKKLGGGGSVGVSSTGAFNRSLSARERALAAAEQRRRQQEEQEEKKKRSQEGDNE